MTEPGALLAAAKAKQRELAEQSSEVAERWTRFAWGRAPQKSKSGTGSPGRHKVAADFHDAAAKAWQPLDTTRAAYHVEAAREHRAAADQSSKLSTELRASAKPSTSSTPSRNTKKRAPPDGGLDLKAMSEAWKKAGKPCDWRSWCAKHPVKKKAAGSWW